MTHADLTRFMHSRYAVVLAGIITAVAAWYVAQTDMLPCPSANGGLVTAWDNVALPPQLSLITGLVVNVGIALLLIYLNKVYNLLRSMTLLQGTVFLLMETAAPAMLIYVSRPLLLALVVVCCMFLMYATYSDVGSLRGVFLVFFLLSTGAAVDVTNIIYIPVFILGCAQMRVFGLRSMLAMLMGLATPWIILLGFGIVSPDEIQMPVLRQLGSEGVAALMPAEVFAVILSGSVAVTAWLQNLFKYLTYNAHSRAQLSLVTVLTFVTVVAAAVDYTDFYSYLPLLNVCAALQIGHLFGAVHTGARSYLAILSIFLLYILNYLWIIAICM